MPGHLLTARRGRQSSEQLRRKMECTKRSFSCKALAQAEANYLMKRTQGYRKRKGSGDKLRAYECPLCKTWHLTKQRKGRMG
jgi:hypothetical protein